MDPTTDDPSGAHGRDGETLTDDTDEADTNEAHIEADTDEAHIDEDYLELDQPRSRWTTVLVVALIFAVGVLCGGLLTRAVSPSPAPRIVYVLSDASAAPSPSATARAR